MTVSDDEFADLIGQALDELPQDYVQRMLQDVAVTWATDVTPEQRAKQKLQPNQTLFGLYEGTPRPQRMLFGVGGQQPLPDKITIFKKPIEGVSATHAALKNQIKKTVWHEMAHYFGLNHDRIHELE